MASNSWDFRLASTRGHCSLVLLAHTAVVEDFEENEEMGTEAVDPGGASTRQTSLTRIFLQEIPQQDRVSRGSTETHPTDLTKKG